MEAEIRPPNGQDRRLDPRLYLALVAGKLAGLTSRFVGRGGGTSLPGVVARRVEPRILSRLGARARIPFVAITGSNGKTTTGRLAAALLHGEGVDVISNAAGANLVQGVTSLLVESSDLRGRLPDAVVLAEVDEAALPIVASDVPLRGLVVTNLFRDQLDRFGELYAVAQAIDTVASALPDDAVLVLNADDPLVAVMGAEHQGRRVTFGLELDRSTDEITRAADTIRCPRCRAELLYRAVYLSHLGDYACPSCSFLRPALDVAVTAIDVLGLAETRCAIRTPDGELSISVPQAGVHVAYDAAAAIAITLALGVSTQHAGASLERVPPAFGRLETIEADGRPVVLAFAKNPTSFNTTLRTLAAVQEPRYLLLAMTNTLVDGEDFAWLWDVDVERSVPLIDRAIVSGARADELANRLKYAGLDPARIATVPDPPAALEQGLASLPPGARLTVIAGYTPTIEIREAMSRRGWVSRFWEAVA
jgi:UDP-N-acetylmuramyl tripeptide synthase